MKALFFAVAAAILAIYILAAQIGIESQATTLPVRSTAQAVPGPPAPAPPVPAVAPVVADLVVGQGRLISGYLVVKAQQGDEIVLRITSDRADELHLHGYDRHAQIKAGTASTVTLKADRTGRFPFELHKSHLQLGALEVYPR